MMRYGILGHPVDHSLSPAIHNSAFKALEIDAHYDHFDVHPEKLADFFAAIHKENIAGLSVTIPHKIACMKFLDKISDSAQAMGAVNTIKIEDGKLLGENVDWIGVQKAFNRDLTGRKALIAGAGGAARAIIYALKKMGCHDIIVCVRSPEKYASEDYAVDTIENCTKYDTDILINATPVGMHEDQSVFLKEYIANNMIIFDAVYTPLKTRLIQDAESAGAETITGEKMLLHQAIAQFEWWTGKKAPVSVMQEALLTHLS